MAAVLGMFIPFHVSAAVQDTVTLNQEGENVAVLLEMSDAKEENITAVSVSLQINTQGNDQIAVDFEFSPELENGEYGFKYRENGDNTGKLDIYAATGTAGSLFGDNGLDLGNLKITSKNPSQTIPVTISYCDGSFQTANAAYGSKTPMVEQETASISMQIGGKAVSPPQEDIPGTGAEGEQKPGTDNPGSGNPNGGGQESGGQGNGNQGSGNSGGSNMNEGLYDTTTQFTNNPSNAQNIPSSIIGNSNTAEGLIDLSAMAGQTSSGSALAAKGKGAAKTTGKVSVVAPKDGMSGILVSNAENDASPGEGEKGGFTEDAQGQEMSADGSMEIKLDKENGGIIGGHKNGLGKILPMAGLGIALILIIGLIIFAASKIKDADRRKRRRRKQKPSERGKGKKGNGTRKKRKKRHPKHYKE